MKHKLSTLAGALVMLLATGCSQDLIEEINPTETNNTDAISFRASTGRNEIGSRAANVATETLTSFKVWAYGTLYNGEHCTFIPGAMVNGSYGDPDHYTTTTTYLWPTDIRHMDFFAIGSQNRVNNDADAVYENGEFQWTAPDLENPGGRAYIENFVVRHDDPVAWASTDQHFTNTEASKQEDVIVALTHRQKSVNNEVYLAFEHAMSSVNVKLVNDYDEAKHDGTQVIKVKGAWIVTSHNKWTFNFTPDACPESQDVHNQNGANVSNCAWTSKEGEHEVYADDTNVDTKVAAYGYVYDTPVVIEPGTTAPLLVREKDGSAFPQVRNNTNIILPSQSLKGWKDSHGVEVDGVHTSDEALVDGAYLLLLVRLELHPTATQHIGECHQLFPSTKHFGANEYSYVCVPLEHNLQPGKEYTYTVHMLGKYGFGQYPPSNHPMPVIANIEGYGHDFTKDAGFVDVNGEWIQAKLDEPRVVVYRAINGVTPPDYNGHPKDQATNETNIEGDPIFKPAHKTFGSPVLEKAVVFMPEVNTWTGKIGQDHAK